MTGTQLVTAVFRNREDAELAIDYLHACGHKRDTINVMSADKGPPLGMVANRPPRVSRRSLALQGMAIGGVIGIVIGAAILAVLSIGTAVAIPRLGVVAGPIVAGAAGAGIGAIIGNFFGLLVGLMLPADGGLEATYQQALAGGGTVLGVRPHSADEAGQIQQRFRLLNGENVSCAACV